MKPTVGRIVHYTLPAGRGEGQVRPAIVVRIWGGDHPSIQLQVFTDSDNDGLPPIVWKTSVTESNTGESELGRWHWPKREAE